MPSVKTEFGPWDPHAEGENRLAQVYTRHVACVNLYSQVSNAIVTKEESSLVTIQF